MTKTKIEKTPEVRKKPQIAIRLDSNKSPKNNDKEIRQTENITSPDEIDAQVENIKPEVLKRCIIITIVIVLLLSTVASLAYNYLSESEEPIFGSNLL